MATYIDANGVWVDWNIASTNTADATWITWNLPYASTTTNTIILTSITGWEQWNNVYQETQEQRQEREERERAQREAWAERERKAQEERITAEAKAEKLLRDNLDAQQQKELDEQGHFHVRVVGEQERMFRITRGWSGNVLEVDETGKRVASYCIHPRDVVPYADNMLAQKLMLEADPDTFMRLANRTAARQ